MSQSCSALSYCEAVEPVNTHLLRQAMVGVSTGPCKLSLSSKEEPTVIDYYMTLNLLETR